MIRDYQPHSRWIEWSNNTEKIKETVFYPIPRSKGWYKIPTITEVKVLSIITAAWAVDSRVKEITLR
jgi:hypothetical protein